MALLDWIFVVFGAAVALTGGWIQLYPERIIPGLEPPSHAQPNHAPPSHAQPNHAQPDRRHHSGQLSDWQLEPGARIQIRLLGACFLFMGTFFALQMTTDLIHRPWWIGTLSGLVSAIAAVSLIYRQVRRQSRRNRRAIPPSRLPEKALELR